jgi:molecular chaperone DnaK (HSP70)
VGWEADAARSEGGADVFYSVKRIIGRRAAEVSEVVALLAYRTAASSDGLTTLVVAGNDGRTLLPEEVSAAVLRVLLQRAEAAVGHSVDSAVITVPAHFDGGQREATKRAGILAGLRHVELLQVCI